MFRMISSSNRKSSSTFLVSFAPVALLPGFFFAPAVLRLCSGCAFGKKSVSFGKKSESASVFLLCRKMFVSLHRLSGESRQRRGATYNGLFGAYYRV